MMFGYLLFHTTSAGVALTIAGLLNPIRVDRNNLIGGTFPKLPFGYWFCVISNLLEVS